MTTIQTLAAAAILSLLVACGAKYTPPPIVVTFDPGFPPPTSLTAGATVGIAADVANDTSGSGNVNWSCSPANACGTFTPAATHSTAPTSYQAPAQSGAVTVTATSVTDSTKSVSATIMID